ncbi:MAG: protease complex subunit PrcB family protein [Lachnospiraceae bacterium]
MSKTRKIIQTGVILMLAAVLVCGCKVEEKNDKKLREMEFTVISEKEVPEELKKIIEEKKTNEMKLTYMTDKNLYIVRGYGQQKTGGYSIKVKDLYLTENAVYLKTELMGPGEGDTTKKAKSYPYIVVKTEKTEDVVVFE